MEEDNVSGGETAAHIISFFPCGPEPGQVYAKRKGSGSSVEREQKDHPGVFVSTF